jgi:hypothetical protein
MPVQSDLPRPALPLRGSCPACGAASTWLEALQREASQGWKQSRRGGRKRAPLKADPAAKCAPCSVAALGSLLLACPLLTLGSNVP